MRRKAGWSRSKGSGSRQMFINSESSISKGQFGDYAWGCVKRRDNPGEWAELDHRASATADDGSATRHLPSRASIRAASLVPTISRADLAYFMLRQLEDDTYVRQAPAVMY